MGGLLQEHDFVGGFFVQKNELFLSILGIAAVIICVGMTVGQPAAAIGGATVIAFIGFGVYAVME